MAKKTRTLPPTKSPSRLIVATVAAAAKGHVARRRAIAALIKRRIEVINESFYDIGQALLEMSTHAYYRAPDPVTGVWYETFDAWLAAEGIVKRAFAFELMAIARDVDRETALKAGPTKAYALVKLKKATPAADTAKGLLAHGRVGGRSAARASAAEIEAEARAEKAKRPTAADRERALAADETRRRALALVRAGTGKRARAEVRGDEVHVIFARRSVDAG